MWTVKFSTLRLALVKSSKGLLCISIQVFNNQRRQAQDGSKLVFQEVDHILPLKRASRTLNKQL
jgi:hypothetical protein